MEMAAGTQWLVMDDTTTEEAIDLRACLSREDRRLWTGFAAAILIIGLIVFARGHYGFAVFLLLMGSLILYNGLCRSNVVWIIANRQILITEQRPRRRPRTRIVTSDDISYLHVRNFRLAFKLASGEILTAPPITDLDESRARIARKLRLRDVEPAAKARDAADTEIHLGSPVSIAQGQANRLIALILAGLLSVPYLFKIWTGEPLAVAEILLIPIGLTFVVTRFIYAYRLCGTFWIIRQGEIRIEWIALNGRPGADTIKGSDIASVSIGPPSGGWDSENRQCALHIRSHSGQELRSPEIGDENAGLAMLPDIARRLGVELRNNRV